MSVARVLTDAEVREAFFAYLEQRVNEKIPGRTERERRIALIFSLLTFLDGVHMHFPKWILAPDPHPADQPFRAARGENWWPENHRKRMRGDLSGHLHDDWAARMFSKGAP